MTVREENPLRASYSYDEGFSGFYSPSAFLEAILSAVMEAGHLADEIQYGNCLN